MENFWGRREQQTSALPICSEANSRNDANHCQVHGVWGLNRSSCIYIDQSDWIGMRVIDLLLVTLIRTFPGKRGIDCGSFNVNPSSPSENCVIIYPTGCLNHSSAYLDGQIKATEIRGFQILLAICPTRLDRIRNSNLGPAPLSPQSSITFPNYRCS